MKKNNGHLTVDQLEGAAPGIQWDRFNTTWLRSWRGNDRNDLEVAVACPDRTWPCWRVGLAWGKRRAFPELQRMFPEAEPDPAGNRLVAQFAGPQEVLEAVSRYHRELATSEIDVTRPPKLATENEGWAWKTAIFLAHAVSDPTGLGPDLEKVDARLFADSHDNLFIVGRSKAAAAAGLRWGDPGSWREHLVQCNLIRDEALRLAATRISTAELANFLLAHFRVVLLTEEEAKRLDSMRTPSGANLRDNMPDGWQWFGDVFARLKFAGIELE